MAVSPVYAQQPVTITNNLDQHIFTFGEVQYLEDTSGRLTIGEVSSPAFNGFAPNRQSTPQNHHLGAVYWYRIKIKHNPAVQKHFILEYFDQTIDEITAYMPAGNGQFRQVQLGDRYPFSQRLFRHKNFELNLDNSQAGEQVYYFRIRSEQIADVIIVLRSVNKFVSYALNEYFSFGIFYGMILIFSFYNLIMFLAVRQRQYLYYVLYNLSVALYEMCTDGIAYQYLWPHAPVWNQYAFAVPLCCMSIFALLFTRKLLYVKSRAPLLNKVILGIVAARVLLFLAALLVNRTWFNYKFIEMIPLAVAFFTGIYIWSRGYRPARFFVLAYSFLFVGFMLKFFIMLGYEWLNFGVVSYYSLSFCFILEMFFLSFAIGDKVRLLKKKKDKAQRQIISQMTENARLKDTLNRELESQVRQRTKEVIQKSELIARQNQELQQANQLLQEQAAEISRMNALLEQDNRQLQTNVEKVSRARVLSAPVDFEEFSKIYPDKESCFKFLADLKWSQGYACRKCGHDHFFNGHLLYSRRCAKCGYEESVTANTILQNTRIDINKAFYMIFLVYSTKGKISSHKLSEILDIRQSTCWSYSSRIKKVMEERKKTLRHSDEKGWSKLVMEYD
ncbi:MAG TPA: 7TM diverse intracellular signaling domain-containing protein [Chitinophaga sp.]|uniref:7TM diverse intracellular signaling domain-containing protein n=1 Tax=Chitinophaga sp. TaxID=1869181 RepID=UPI002DBBE1E9|nr:7TM diverse intracellular signaling domain-containing protein [Chitinophaga sp.]HEU4555615.1 7TM diverse intracellular signaling domain-containing protein [Chitinophaga sp.]